jgi:arylsulfatase A-like enzyme
MFMDKDLSRRLFLEQFSTCVAGGTALSQLINQRAIAENAPHIAAAELFGAAGNAAPWVPRRVLTNPNILLIMVDQMRSPRWLNSSQMTTLNQQFLPNIFGKLRNHSYNFQQYYVAATVCSASRATLLTGLYAPQTAAYLNLEQNSRAPALNPAFPTWAAAVSALNPTYQNSFWWFGKWHLSNCSDSDPLRPYGWNTRTYPGGAARNPSPDGYPNEGANGGQFEDQFYASDADIAGDFVGWLQGQAPSPGPPSSPWCAAVSLINPHDAGGAPAWLDINNYPPNVPSKGVSFPPPLFPPPDGPPALYTSYPSPWNYENLRNVASKPGIQLAYQDFSTRRNGKVTNWPLLLNQYYWEQSFVDRQVGAVLAALDASGQSGNTIVIFTSDHGDYAGSHGLHGKGYSAYEEAIRVPFYVRFPGQSDSIPMNQMCSSVDVFGLVCDLATNGGDLWRQSYPDLGPRQSMWSFLYRNAPETRIAPSLGIPYILHTCDLGNLNGENGHIVCIRTKSDASNAAQPGAKLAIYSSWDPCSTIPNSTPPDFEFYDYNPLTANNWRELGNDYSSSSQVATNYENALGTWGQPSTGLIATELNAPLIGTGIDGLPLTEAQTAARQNYFDAKAGAGVCTAQTAGEAFAR